MRSNLPCSRTWLGLIAFFSLVSGIKAQNCPPKAFSVINQDCFCPGQPVTMTVVGPPGNYEYWWSNGDSETGFCAESGVFTRLGIERR